MHDSGSCDSGFESRRSDTQCGSSKQTALLAAGFEKLCVVFERLAREKIAKVYFSCNEINPALRHAVRKQQANCFACGGIRKALRYFRAAWPGENRKGILFM